MRIVTLLRPKRIVFGNGCAVQCADEVLGRGLRRAMIVTSPPILPLVEPLVDALRTGKAEVSIYSQVDREPSLQMLDEALELARAMALDAVIGVGGGSAMDVAKLVAALHNGQQDVREILGIELLSSRSTYLACLPTTSGTGSEVSPVAIMLDEEEELKKGAVSPHLVPDAAYVDPLLTITMPPSVTAATGVDALTHCIEVYANRFAHPMVDLYVLEGIRLISANLQRAVENGKDEDARANMARASLYGGLGLGPVNTGAVHALSYPLGGTFHIAHGVANAMLLPYVLEYNLPAMPERYADVAKALGVEGKGAALDTARRGVERIRQLSRACGIPQKMAEMGIPADVIPDMARAAMTVSRLLKNNPREFSLADTEAVYRSAHS